LCCLFLAELKILDDPLPFKKSKEKLDKEEEAAIQDVSTEVRFIFDCFFIKYIFSSSEISFVRH